MPKKTKRSHIAQKKLGTVCSTEAKRNISPLALLLGLATLLGGLAAALAFIPRPYVSVSDPVDSANPFSSKFTIKNGNIPLSDVCVAVGFGKINLGNVIIGTVGGKFPQKYAVIQMEKWQHHYLNMDEGFDVTPADIFGPGPSTLQKADIAIIVKYKPWFIPIRRSKAFRYEAHKQTNGNFYWYELPLQ